MQIFYIIGAIVSTIILLVMVGVLTFCIVKVMSQKYVPVYEFEEDDDEEEYEWVEVVMPSRWDVFMSWIKEETLVTRLLREDAERRNRYKYIR